MQSAKGEQHDSVGVESSSVLRVLQTTRVDNHK